jgi:hypothetical protein
MIYFTPSFLNIIIDFAEVKLDHGLFRSGDMDENRAAG